MSKSLRHSLVAGVAAFAMLSAPVLLDNTGLSLLSDIDAVAGNGKGKGGGNGNGGGNGGGGGNGHANAASKSGNGAAKGKKKATEEVVVEEATFEVGSRRSLNAELGRLNSLKRNINGLMNSADPKMDGIRAYVIANGTLVDAQAALETANAELATAEDAYAALAESLGVGSYANIRPAGLDAELERVNAALVDTPDDPALLEEQARLTLAIETINASPELAALIVAVENQTGAGGDVMLAEDAVSEDALREALLLAANPNRRSDDYLTDEIMAWASNELGVDDAEGLIDEYLATR